MDSAKVTASSLDSVEAGLREALARGDAVLSTATPILRHLLASEDHALFSDQIVARVRGMLADIARQLHYAQAEQANEADRAAFAAGRGATLVVALADRPALLGHLHALTIEAQTAATIHQRTGIDPVLSPLLQELVASRDETMAAAAMSAIAAQARFVQQQRRMALPLGELPGDLFHAALEAFLGSGGSDQTAERAARKLRESYDESLGRIGLLAQLVVRMGKAARRALDVDSAGLSLFATALGMASGQERETTVLSFSDRQFARLALALRAAGLKHPEVEEQLLQLRPDVALPEGFDGLSADRAGRLLAGGGAGGR